MVFAHQSHNIGNLVQREHSENSGGIGVGPWGRSSQQKYCNISETGQHRTKVTIDDQRAINWCQNQWMTLKGHYALRSKTHASFGAHHENLNEDRPTLSATKM